MTPAGLEIAVCGLSLTSSWGNGHATTYRALLKALAARGHHIRFFERDVPWYRENRDLPDPPYCEVILYESLHELQTRFEAEIVSADAVIVGSYVPEGVALGRWIIDEASSPVCFYDIDTPITLAKLSAGDYEYISPDLVPRYDQYFSFTGGPTLRRIEKSLGSPSARALYCSADVSLYYPLPKHPKSWLMGYLGTYSPDRQPKVETLLTGPAAVLSDQAFVVAGPNYPLTDAWPRNIELISHLSPADHRAFYNSQRFTLNITRSEMVGAGYSPSVRLFEAASCGVPIISDYWDGIEELFDIGSEIFIAQSTEQCLRILRNTPESKSRAVGNRARNRIHAEHTSRHRAAQLETYLFQALSRTRIGERQLVGCY
jgi:spore maturation protein CgeB